MILCSKSVLHLESQPFFARLHKTVAFVILCVLKSSTKIPDLKSYIKSTCHKVHVGAQWLCGRVLDSSPRGRGFEPHRRHYVVSLSKNINPSLVLIQPRKTRPFITERLLMGRKESNQTNKVHVP